MDIVTGDKHSRKQRENKPYNVILFDHIPDLNLYIVPHRDPLKEKVYTECPVGLR